MNRFVREVLMVRKGFFCMSARGNHKIDIFWVSEKIKEKMKVGIADIL